jgi:dolichol-phosphate mannosyltransferase
MKSIAILPNLEWWPLFKRYTKFCIVGGTGVVVDMGIIWLLSDSSMLGWNLTLSKVIAAEVAIFNNFLWNDIWTFRGLRAERNQWLTRLIRFGKFNLICVAGIAFSVLLLSVQVYWLHVNVYLANFISIVVVSVWNFLMNLKFGWKTGAEEKPQTAEPAARLR